MATAEAIVLFLRFPRKRAAVALAGQAHVFRTQLWEHHVACGPKQQDNRDEARERAETKQGH